MACKDCKYKGQYFPHLDDYDLNSFDHKKEGNKWFNCDYPLPCFATPEAIMEHFGEGCKVYEKKLTKHKIMEARELLNEISAIDLENVNKPDAMDYATWEKRKLDLINRFKEGILTDFFEWINGYEDLEYTKKGIKFYVDEFCKTKVK